VVYPPTGSMAMKGRWAPRLRSGGARPTLPLPFIPKRPRPKRPTNFWHVQNGPHRCPKRPNTGTKRPRAM